MSRERTVIGVCRHELLVLRNIDDGRRSFVFCNIFKRRLALYISILEIIVV